MSARLGEAPPRWLHKIDHRLRALWMRVPERERATQTVRVLVKLSGPHERLAQLGVRVHSVAGDIASCTIALSDVPRIAAEVSYIEAAQPLDHDS